MSEKTERDLPLSEDEDLPPLQPRQEAEIRRGIAAADAGRFVSDDQLRAIIRKYARHGG
ncbi:MAG: hypothetical protein AAFY02_08020 [Pseudomonadota bacterium]